MNTGELKLGTLLVDTRIPEITFLYMIVEKYWERPWKGSDVRGYSILYYTIMGLCDGIVCGIPGDAIHNNFEVIA